MNGRIEGDGFGCRQDNTVHPSLVVFVVNRDRSEQVPLAGSCPPSSHQRACNQCPSAFVHGYVFEDPIRDFRREGCGRLWLCRHGPLWRVLRQVRGEKGGIDNDVRPTLASMIGCQRTRHQFDLLIEQAHVHSHIAGSRPCSGYSRRRERRPQKERYLLILRYYPTIDSQMLNRPDDSKLGCGQPHSPSTCGKKVGDPSGCLSYGNTTPAWLRIGANIKTSNCT